MFKSSADRFKTDLRPQGTPLEFGIHYLDSALKGIFNDDLILVGAPSGIGKTQLCVNLALTNCRAGKKVYLFALEASENEIEDRIRYQAIARDYFNDFDKPDLGKTLNYADWRFRKFDDKLSVYDSKVDECVSNLHTFYKNKNFGIKELVENIELIKDTADLIIIDHAHYFDFDDDNENRALKELAKTVRTLSQVIRKPIVLIAHLRKANKAFKEIAAGIDEFHGSSDLTKIATRVITIAKGKSTSDHSETYIRICKDRFDGSTTNYIGLVKYIYKTQQYEDRFNIGRLSYDGREFDEIEIASEFPLWMK